MKPDTEYANITEVHFLALPGMRDAARMLEVSPYTEAEKHSLMFRYRNKLSAIARLQRKAAVEALAICRPLDWRESDREYKHKVAIARHEHEERCLAVFTEKCTRGL